MKRGDKVVVWVAQGFGIGRVPFAPGTFGSVLGLLWTAFLLEQRSSSVFFGSAILTIFISVWFCGEAERILNQKDPPSVVLDEIVAMPFCYVTLVWSRKYWPPLTELSARDWLCVVLVFAAFRLFDIWKPWPVRQSQSLPGGWGVTVDDLLAALYVNLVSLPFLIG